MKQRPLRQRTPFALAAAAFITLATLALGLANSSADITVKNQPASGGRRITPAGRLVKDLTTGLPAVGALPVSFVRSPDRRGPQGGGITSGGTGPGAAGAGPAGVGRGGREIGILLA